MTPIVETVEKYADEEATKEEVDVVVVSATAGKRLTRAEHRKWEKKRSVLSIGEKSEDKASTGVERDLEKLEAEKDKRLKSLKKGKRVAVSGSKGERSPKKKRGLVDSDKEEDGTKAVIDTADSDSGSDSTVVEKSRGKLRKNESLNIIGFNGVIVEIACL